MAGTRVLAKPGLDLRPAGAVGLQRLPGVRKRSERLLGQPKVLHLRGMVGVSVGVMVKECKGPLEAQVEWSREGGGMASSSEQLRASLNPRTLFNSRFGLKVQ